MITFGFLADYSDSVAAGILASLGWEFVKTAVYQDAEHSLYRCKLNVAQSGKPAAAGKSFAKKIYNLTV